MRTSTSRVTRVAKAGLACTLLTALAACQAADSHSSAQKPAVAGPTTPGLTASAWSCNPKTIHWGQPRQSQVLVAASQLVKSTAANKGSQVEFSVVPVRSVKSRVQADGKVDGETLVTSLEKKASIESGELARPGKSVPLEEAGGGIVLHLEGRKKDYASAIGVTVVEASFVYGCASSTRKPVYGTVTTWYDPIAGMIECGTDPRKEYMREAYNLLCGEKRTTAARSAGSSSQRALVVHR